MGKRINEVGNKYGRLEVLEFVEMDNSGAAVWSCKCNCGNITIVRGSNLRSGKVKSCDCLRTGPNSTRASMVGDKHPGYKGDNSSRNIKRRLPIPAPKKKIKSGGKRGRPVGYKMSNDTKTKIREAHTGRKHTTETKEKISYTLREGKNTASLSQILKTDIDTLRMRRSKSGYLFVTVPSGELNVAGSPIPVHRFVVESYLGCKIPLACPIHHINDDVDDYTLDNLYVCLGRVWEHLSIHRNNIGVESNLAGIKHLIDIGEEIW